MGFTISEMRPRKFLNTESNKSRSMIRETSRTNVNHFQKPNAILTQHVHGAHLLPSRTNATLLLTPKPSQQASSSVITSEPNLSYDQFNFSHKYKYSKYQLQYFNILLSF